MSSTGAGPGGSKSASQSLRSEDHGVSAQTKKRFVYKEEMQSGGCYTSLIILSGRANRGEPSLQYWNHLPPRLGGHVQLP